MENVELDEVQWRSPEWIQAFGLHTENVLDYFALSPFYDRSSNNQVLKMQMNFNEQLQNRGAELTKELQKMIGIEYRVAVAREPDLWVIFKQNRTSPTEAEVVAVYFVTGENIYQSPSIYNVLVSRILATCKYLEEALQIAEQLPEFKSSGYEYHKQGPPENIEPTRKDDPSNGQQQSQQSQQSQQQQQQQVVDLKENIALLDRALTISVNLLRSQQFR